MERRPILVALTGASEKALQAGQLEIPCWPFRVGRERRENGEDPIPCTEDRRRSLVRPSNDLYIPDTHPRKYVSRNHFQIEHEAEGFFLMDLQSTCGTFLGGRAVGGARKGGRVPLRNGDIISIGSRESPFRMRFEII